MPDAKINPKGMGKKDAKTIFFVLMSCMAINCYSQTVSLDNTFGQNGITVFQNSSEISLLDFDSHGNIIAAGYTLIGGNYLAIAKANANGSIDSSFGNNGVSKITDYKYSRLYGLKVTNDDKIIVCGGFSKVQFTGYESIIMRFNENGTVDETFGDSGKINLNFNTSPLISFDNDNFILIARYDYQNQIPFIEKYSYEGEIDDTFGENGKVYLPNSIIPYCMRIVSDNSIIIASTYNHHVWPDTELGLCKLAPNGELNTNFANDGIWHMDIMEDFDLDYEFFSNVFEDSEGNLIISGSGLQNSFGWGNRAFLSKFSSNGILDTSFGEDGFYCSNVSNSSKPVFQVGDKYITAGYHDEHKIVVVNKDGSDGFEAYTPTIYYLQDMKLQGTDKIILGGGNTYSSANFALERIIIDISTSIMPNYYSNELIISPNPTKGDLYFSNETTFEIIDIQGRILLKSVVPTKSVNVANLQSGIYFIRLDHGVQKIVKE